MMSVPAMRPKVVALVIASSLTIGWLLASVVSPPVAKLQVLPDRTERRAPAQGDALATPYTEQLQLKLQQAPLPPVPRRNPFVFGSKQVSAATKNAALERGSEGVDPSGAMETPLSIVTGPSLRLSGIGSTGGVRTAVLSDGRTVHLANVGDIVNGYSIVEISEDAVTIADASGAQWKLKMR
jgi:hypothetical protein